MKDSDARVFQSKMDLEDLLTALGHQKHHSSTDLPVRQRRAPPIVGLRTNMKRLRVDDKSAWQAWDGVLSKVLDCVLKGKAEHRRCFFSSCIVYDERQESFKNEGEGAARKRANRRQVRNGNWEESRGIWSDCGNSSESRKNCYMVLMEDHRWKIPTISRGPRTSDTRRYKWGNISWKVRVASASPCLSRAKRIPGGFPKKRCGRIFRGLTLILSEKFLTQTTGPTKQFDLSDMKWSEV